MKYRNSFLTRCLALVLALVLVVSNANLGMVFKANAAERSVSEAEIVANNYDLTAAEKALLESGYLKSGTVEYDLPTDGVTIDIENSKIIAVKQGDWIPVKAVILYGGNELEVALSNGEGTYDPDVVGNSFSVKVTYSLDVNVAGQDALFGAMAALKQGTDSLKAAYAATNANLGTIVEAKDILKKLADGIDLGWASAQFGQAAIDATNALITEINNNDGKMLLQLENAAYGASASKVQYLVENGAAYKAAFVPALEKLSAIAEDGLLNNSILDSYLQSQSPADYTKWQAMKSILKGMVNEMGAVDADAMSAATADMIAENVNFVQLDSLVAALGTLTAVTVKNPLHVASTDVTANLDMFDVTVEVILKNTQGNEVKEYGKKTTVVTLKKDATKIEILNAVEEDGIENAATVAWGAVYVSEHFERTATELPATLTEDTTFVITYSPKNYKVTSNYDDPAELPYGYKLALPVHDDPEQAYDYKINGVAYAQGMEVLVDQDLDIVRTAGKAYTTNDLYTIVAGNFMDDESKGYKILTSGALKGNEAVSVRYPEAADAESLLKLLDGTLSAGNYDAAYNGLSWVPYTYGATGVETLFPAGGAAWSGKEAKVVYRLTLSNYDKAEVSQILQNAATLAEEAKAQKETLDRLAANYTQMEQLDLTKLGALNGVIGVTDFTPDDGTSTDAKNLELRAYFADVVGKIIDNNVDPNNYLKIYNMLTQYNADGLFYYYMNSAAVINEINMLAEYLGKMTAEEEALKIMVTAAGFPEYAEKITDLEKNIAEVKAALTAPNALIDLNSASLNKLVDALEVKGAVAYSEASSPWLTSGALTALDESQRNITVSLSIPGKQTVNFTTESMDRGSTITAEIVNGLKAQIVANTTIDTNLYTLTIAADPEGTIPCADIDALVGQELDDNVFVYYIYTVKEFYVAVPDAGDAVISVNNKKIDLPQSADPAVKFVYSLVDGAGEIVRTIDENATFVTLSDAEFALAVAGKLSIQRETVDLTSSTLEELVDAMNAAAGAGSVVSLVEENGAFTGMNISGNMKQVMAAIMELAQTGKYSYVGLNNEGFKYLLGGSTLEICMQTLVNAILMDDDFSNDAVISLCENGSGKLFKASLQLGSAANELVYANMNLVVNISGIPEQLTSRVDLIKTVSNYIQFHTENGTVTVDVTLPDQVYGAYAAALVATGKVEKTDVNSVSQKVALQFLHDYLEAIAGTEMDMVTFNNTLKKLGVNKDLTRYNSAYNKGMEAYRDWLTIAINDDGASLDASAPGKTVIDALLDMSGMELESAVMGLLKEYKDGGTINASVFAKLLNTDKTYYALIADVEAEGMTNKLAAPSSYDALASETSTLAGYSAMMLLADVPGDLTISGTTILDLNGKNINGKINATGKLIIIDSMMDTYGAGSVKGVTGNAVIVAGNYESDVSAYLKEGYYMDGTTVRNAMYYITDKDGTVSFVLNGDFYESEHMDGYFPNEMAIAVDIASDLALNYALSGTLSVGGHSLIDVKEEDLVGLVDGDNKVENLIQEAISWVTVGEATYEKNVGLEALINDILEDILDFNAITTALKNNTALATYAVERTALNIEIAHVKDGNYATIKVGSNDDLRKSFNVALFVESKHTEKVAALTDELSKIVSNETEAVVDIPALQYSNKELTVNAAGKAVAVVDVSNNSNYATMIGVVLAYGNSAKRADVAAAINNGNMAALKNVVDGTSVKELFTALKKLSRDVDFAKMATAVGVTVDVAEAAELEAIYHLYLCAAGKALEKLEVTGMDSKLGGLYNEQTGYYELTKDKMFGKEFSARGYSAMVNLEVTEVNLKVKLFGDVCTVRDPDHSGKIDIFDLIYLRQVLATRDPDMIICEYCADFDGSGEIDIFDVIALRQHLAAAE